MRKPEDKLFSPRLIGWSLAHGVVALAGVAVMLFATIRVEMPENEMRALVFFSLVAVILALVFANRSFSSSLSGAVGRLKLPMIIVLAFICVVLALAVAWPVAQGVFRFGPLHFPDIAIALGIGIGVLLLLEFIKPLFAAGSSVGHRTHGSA